MRALRFNEIKLAEKKAFIDDLFALEIEKKSKNNKFFFF